MNAKKSGPLLETRREIHPDQSGEPTLRETQRFITQALQMDGPHRDFRLNLYKQGAQQKYLNLIFNTFESTLSFLTPSRRAAVGAAYAHAHASSRYAAFDSLEWFPEFVRTLPELRKHPYLHELAIFEWRLAVADYSATDSSILYSNATFGFRVTTEILVFNWTLSLAGELLHRVNADRVRPRRQFIALCTSEHAKSATEISVSEVRALMSVFPETDLSHRLSVCLAQKASAEPAQAASAAIQRLLARGVIFTI